MKREDIFNYYSGIIGAICISVPAFLYLIAIIVSQSPKEIIRLIILFAPLIIAALFFFKPLYNSNLIAWAKTFYIKVPLTWGILYLISALISTIVWSIIHNEMAGYIETLPIRIISYLILGLIFGIFFIPTYILLFRIAHRLRKSQTNKNESLSP